MIKFQCIIHKETGTVIPYKEWYESTRDYLRIGDKKFNPIDILFSNKNDFEIIYNSEFTLQELALLFDNINQKELADKILNLCIEKKVIKDKYGIDI